MRLAAITLLLLPALAFAEPLRVSGGDLPPARVERWYAVPLEATGGTAPYTWSIVGELPEGIVLDGDVLDGVPASPGIAGFELRVVDAAGSSAQAPARLKVEGSEPLLAFWDVPGHGQVGEPFSAAIRAQGGAPPYELSAMGELPRGLRSWVDGAALVIRGVPEQEGPFGIVLRVSDSLGDGDEHAFEFVILPADGPGIVTKELPDAPLGAPYAAAMESQVPAAWSVVGGALPPGLVLAQDGTFSGTATQPGVYAFSVEARAGAGREVQPMGIRVLPGSGTEDGAGGCSTGGSAAWAGIVVIAAMVPWRRGRGVSAGS